LQKQYISYFFVNLLLSISLRILLYHKHPTFTWLFVTRLSTRYLARFRDLKKGGFYRGRCTCKYTREQEVNLSYKLGEGIFREEAYM